jgi:predicted phosphodiesterase
MRLQLASDLHLKHIEKSFPGELLIQPTPGADVLILAGDIASGVRALELFKNWPVPVLFVAGNHEFYGLEIERARQQLRSYTKGGNVTVLDNACVEFGGVRFLGATLWTDYQIPHDMTQVELMAFAEENFPDHRHIRFRDDKFSTKHALAEHNQSSSPIMHHLSVLSILVMQRALRMLLSQATCILWSSKRIFGCMAMCMTPWPTNISSVAYLPIRVATR